MKIISLAGYVATIVRGGLSQKLVTEGKSTAVSLNITC
jgi:hypothetical protein